MKNLFLLLICLLSFGAFAQVSKDSLNGPTTIGGDDFNYTKPKKYILGPIKIEGADNYDHQAIKLIAGLRQGDEIMVPSDKISNAIKNLWNEGLFSSVDIVSERVSAGVIYLIIRLQPRPKISRIKYSGVPRRDVDKIREEVKLNSGKTITENMVFNTESIIRNYFKEKGYNNVNVNIIRVQDTLINNSEIFHIQINKGEKVRIKEIVIDGAVSVKMWKLKSAMKDTKQKRWWRFFKRSKFNTTAYGRDKDAVLDKLRSTGLRDVFLVTDSVYQIDDRNMG